MVELVVDGAGAGGIGGSGPGRAGDGGRGEGGRIGGGCGVGVVVVELVAVSLLDKRCRACPRTACIDGTRLFQVVDRLVGIIDIDGNGLIDYDEFLQALKTRDAAER